jgi:RNA polymerase I-specific transcription initiation factor RRN6
LSQNPIVNLKIETTGGRPHADICFNPWYIRQFALVDQRGYWSVWDCEGQKTKRTTYRATVGRSGHIFDDIQRDEAAKLTYKSDGWGQILWVGSVSTLLVADRRHLALFDLKSKPRRLNSPELVPRNSTGCILQVRRSVAELDQVFVLTTSRIFLLKVKSASENFEPGVGDAGAIIILSCPHFRDSEDETVKIELLRNEEGRII